MARRGRRWGLVPGESGSQNFAWRLTGSVGGGRLRPGQALLKESLREEGQYTLSVGTSGPAAVIGEVTLTGAEVVGLRTGNVLVVDERSWNPEEHDVPPLVVVSRQNFDQLACSDGFPVR